MYPASMNETQAPNMTTYAEPPTKIALSHFPSFLSCLLPRIAPLHSNVASFHDDLHGSRYLLMTRHTRSPSELVFNLPEHSEQYQEWFFCLSTRSLFAIGLLGYIT